MNKLLLGTLCITINCYAFAQTVSAGGGSAVNPISSTPTSGTGTNGPAAGTTNIPQPVTLNPSRTNSIQAQNNQNTQTNGTQAALGGVAIGGSIAAIAYGISTNAACWGCGAGTPWIIGGVAGIIVGGVLMSQASSSAGTSAANAAAVTNGGLAPSPVTSGGLPPQAVSALKQAAAAGVKYNPATGTVTMPSGASVPASQLAAGDFSGTGMTPAQQSAAKDALGGIIKDSQAKLAAGAGSNDNPETGGGGGAGGGGPGSAGLGADGMGMGAGFKPPVRNAASVAGAKVRLADGSAIGAANGDGLFIMINNRYKATGASNMGFVSPQ